MKISKNTFVFTLVASLVGPSVSLEPEPVHAQFQLTNFITGDEGHGCSGENAEDVTESETLLTDVDMQNFKNKRTKKVKARKGTKCVYCFNVTNTGTIRLVSLDLSDPYIDYNYKISSLEVGETQMFAVPRSINRDLMNIATIKGNPDLKDVDEVTTSDPSEVVVIEATPTPSPNLRGSDGSTNTKDGGGGVMGDPHFKTWTGHLYDFHGACDLVLVHSKNFGEGLGLDIHVRTEIRDDWSFVAAAAIKIGKDTLEVGGFGRYYFNGIKDANIDTISGFPIQHRRGGKNQSMFIVELGKKGKIYVKVYKDLLAVSVSDTTGEHFGDAVGLMGEFKTGNMIGRDGETVFDKDPSAYGLDWQVRDTELVLFHEVKGPQYPVQCTMPPPISEKRRRLQASSVSYEEAERACAKWSGHAEKDLCISDVMVTGDLGMAQAGAF